MQQTKNFTPNLVKWYKHNARDLPWRQTNDPYKIWISEIMLQQTTVTAVIPYYRKWIKLFPTVHSVAKAPLQKILNTWQGLGYYSRARNIHKSSKIISKQFNGKIPQDPDALKKLPGFGPYTTGAVLSIAFNKKMTIIDANVRRVVMRQLCLRGHADTRHDRQIGHFLESALPNKNVGDFNQALMELGALVCRNREVLCNICPVRKSCQAYKAGLHEVIPTPKKKVIKDVHAVVALIKKDGSYFIQRRGPKGLFADLWEFPGGKIEKGESPRKAIYREVKEELNVDLASAKQLMDVKQYYTEFKAHLNVFSCQIKSPPKVDKTHRWVKFKDLTKYPMPSGSTKILDKLSRK